MQDLIRKVPGVISTRVGYSGGDVPNATYRHHGNHAEAIEIIFDPARLSYRDLLEFFFQIHDPTTRNRQGNDIGASYRSAIFYTDDEQKRIAEETIADVDASACGRARSSPRSPQPARSGRPNLSTRTTWSATPTATPATTSARGGGSSTGRTLPAQAALSSGG
jgi:methionine-S-sulfoxide reductase